LQLNAEKLPSKGERVNPYWSSPWRYRILNPLAFVLKYNGYKGIRIHSAGN